MKKNCLMKCGRKARSRGLCTTCLAAAKRLISRSQRTEAELIATGAMLPKAVNGTAERRILERSAQKKGR